MLTRLSAAIATLFALSLFVTRPIAYASPSPTLSVSQVRAIINRVLAKHGEFRGADYFPTCHNVADHVEYRGPYTLSDASGNLITPSELDRMNGRTLSSYNVFATVEYKYVRSRSARGSWGEWTYAQPPVELSIQVDAHTLQPVHVDGGEEFCYYYRP